MPTYEYLCDACAHQFEVEQRITDEAIKTCPKCGEPKVHRLLFPSGFILKGGGWYADLYASKPKAEEKPAETKTETPAATPAETSPAPAASTKPAADKKVAPKPAKKTEAKG